MHATEAGHSDRVFAYGVALLRTAVPSAWGAALGWLTSLGLHLSPAVMGVGQWLVMSAAVAAWYAVWHWIEGKLPPWFTRLVLGANTAPSYPTPEPAKVG